MKTVSIVILLIVIAVGVFSFTNNSQDNVVEEAVNNEVREEQEVAIAKESDLSNGLYTKYKGDLEQYENKDIILFFKASWCPSCRALDGDIKSSLSDIPENVVLLELDYDTETELKRKYGVTTQHTLVQVDTEGNMIKKWSGGNRLEDLLSQID
ncbi:MAG: thioredoxin family protein [bacterium]|nr:thioredoxin family protein [bacterium]